jgi:hypothetical protein
MAVLSRFRPGFRRATTEDAKRPSVGMTPMPVDEKNRTVSGTQDAIVPDNPHEEPEVEQPEKDVLPTEDAQRGVQQVEAVALTWTKPNLIAVFIL